MGKILALDLGNRWIGSALSDSQRIIARPYKTIERANLTSFLEETLRQETPDMIVIGYPKTMSGRVSEQTKRVLDDHQALTTQFPKMTFVLWDERLSSKRAAALSQARTHEEKQKSHSIAAAFILDSYLLYLAQHNSAIDT